MEGKQSPTDSWVRFHTRALNSALCSSQWRIGTCCKEPFLPIPAWLSPKKEGRSGAGGCDCSGAINGDSIALARAPLISRGTLTEPAKVGRVPSPRHPGPPRNSHGALLPPGGTGREPQPSPAPALRELGAGGGVLGFTALGSFFRSWCWPLPSRSHAVCSKDEGMHGLCVTAATPSHFAPSEIRARSQGPGNPPPR